MRTSHSAKQANLNKLFGIPYLVGIIWKQIKLKLSFWPFWLSKSFEVLRYFFWGVKLLMLIGISGKTSRV